MMEQFIELLKEVNIAQIFIILAGGWVMYNRLDKKIDKLGDRVDKLSDKVEDVDKRLCRIEGSLASSGHCLFSQSKQEQKAG